MTNQQPHRNSAAAVAASFVAARKAAVALPDYPGTIPATLDEGYAIQKLAIGLQDKQIAGWKVGRINPALTSEYGAERLVGPIFDGTIKLTGENNEMAVIKDGFAAAEAEFLMQIGDLPSTLPLSWKLSDVVKVVHSVHIGIEIASSPFPGINDHGPAVTVSDFGNNNGLLIGPELSQDTWRQLSIIDVRLDIDGVVAGRARAADADDGPFGAVRFLLELAARLELPVREDHWICTGAVTGVHHVAPGQKVVAHFDSATIATCIVAERASK